MTIKQKLFVKNYIERNGNGTQAALESYDTTNPNVAHSIATENLRKPTIREAIEEVLHSKGLTLSQVTGNLGYFANSRPEKVNAEAALKANIELLKLMHAYPTQKSAHVSLSLKARLNKMTLEEVKKESEKIHAELMELLEDEVIDTP